VLRTLGSAAARRWAVLALAALGEAREEIDALNVFPVPDGDTGTNMYLTLEAALLAAATVPADVPIGRLADTFAAGALLGARGNSGVIGAQLLRGWADTLADTPLLDAAAAVEGFRRADEQAWRAVEEPVEGTILSVSRAAAQAAAHALAQAKPTLESIVSAAATAARQALELTSSQLPALARAGVVDAGGLGFVVVLDSLAAFVLGASRSRPARGHRHPALPAVDFAACAAELIDVRGEGPWYEVMFLLSTDLGDDGTAAIGRLRPKLATLGDSLVIIGGAGLWQVHIHVHDPGAALESALAFGRPHRIRIAHFSESGRLAARRRNPDPLGRAGLVACAAGPGLAALFAGVGAVVVLGGHPDEPGRRPSTGQLLEAVRRTKAANVALLPNDGDTLSVAQAAAATARAEGIRVTVVPTRAQVQGLAAAAVHDPARGFDDDVVAMSAAAGSARDGAVTVATKDGLTSAGECRLGDALGIVDGDFAVIGASLREVAIEVIERLLAPGGELVTIVVGAGGHESLAAEVAAHVHDAHRQLEVSVLDGGQRRYPLLIGVE
jgi:DAK2 domain fusion protein YloV